MDNNTVYYQAEPINPKGTDKANGFICGLIALILSCCCGGGGIVTLILAIISLVQAKAYKAAGGLLDGQYNAGKICAIISLVIYGLAVLGALLYAILYFVGLVGAIGMGAMGNTYYY